MLIITLAPDILNFTPLCTFINDLLLTWILVDQDLLIYFFHAFYAIAGYELIMLMWLVWVSQGCQIFAWSKHTKMGKNLPNNYKLYQTAITYTKWP
jgi:hypothetical protein